MAILALLVPACSPDFASDAGRVKCQERETDVRERCRGSITACFDHADSRSAIRACLPNTCETLASTSLYECLDQANEGGWLSWAECRLECSRSADFCINEAYDAELNCTLDCGPGSSCFANCRKSFTTSIEHCSSDDADCLVGCLSEWPTRLSS